MGTFEKLIDYAVQYKCSTPEELFIVAQPTSYDGMTKDQNTIIQTDDHKNLT